jgi:hypothetical protein
MLVMTLNPSLYDTKYSFPFWYAFMSIQESSGNISHFPVHYMRIWIYVKDLLIFIVLSQQFEWLVGNQYKPMELTKSDWASIRKSPPWAIDSWGLGELN